MILWTLICPDSAGIVYVIAPDLITVERGIDEFKILGTGVPTSKALLGGYRFGQVVLTEWGEEKNIENGYMLYPKNGPPSFLFNKSVRCIWEMADQLGLKAQLRSAGFRARKVGVRLVTNDLGVNK